MHFSHFLLSEFDFNRPGIEIHNCLVRLAWKYLFELHSKAADPRRPALFISPHSQDVDNTGRARLTERYLKFSMLALR